MRRDCILELEQTICDRANIAENLKDPNFRQKDVNREAATTKTKELNTIHIPAHSSDSPGKKPVLCLNTIRELINRNKFIDIHPEAIYEKDPLEEEPLVYMGDVKEKEVEGGHICLVTQSKHPRFMLSPYPESIQPGKREVCTSGDVTWIDNRALEIDKNQEKGLPSHLKDISSEDDLRRIRGRGEENYERIARETTIYPNQWYTSRLGDYSFMVDWHYSGPFNSKNESVEVYMKFDKKPKKRLLQLSLRKTS